MIESVLVPMDDSDMAERALAFALDAYPDATITVLHVVGVPSPLMGEAVTLALADDIRSAGRERAATIFDRAEAMAAEADATIVTEIAFGQPARAIIRWADGYDVVVMGSHGRDVVSRVLMGNVAKLVTRRSPVPVTVVR